MSEVRVSERLTDSPVCLVMPKGGVPAHIERLLRAYQQDLPAQKRILELNPNHALIARLKSEHARDAESATARASGSSCSTTRRCSPRAARCPIRCASPRASRR